MNTYEQPKMDIWKFEVEDVIRTSGLVEGEGDGGTVTTTNSLYYF